MLPYQRRQPGDRGEDGTMFELEMPRFSTNFLVVRSLPINPREYYNCMYDKKMFSLATIIIRVVQFLQVLHHSA